MAIVVIVVTLLILILLGMPLIAVAALSWHYVWTSKPLILRIGIMTIPLSIGLAPFFSPHGGAIPIYTELS